jgi:hypothetical protein
MNELESKYQCSEFLDKYYSEGLFHPTECQMLYAHKNAEVQSDCLVVGEVYDDHDCRICYRKGETGIWAKSNYDGTFQKLSENLKTLTEGWYQVEPNHWRKMRSQTNLNEIIKFYQINDSRYNWESQPLINLILEIQNSNKDENIYAKAHKANLKLSSTNGFIGRPTTKMITVQLDRKKNLLKAFHQSDFFDYDVQSKDFKMSEISSITESILEWIN